MKILLLSVLCLFALVNSAAADAIKIGNIDLTVPGTLQSLDFSVLYDDSFLNLPNFTVYQKDPRLADLFGPGAGSELCVPSVLAQNMIQFYAYHSPRYTQLKLAGLNSNLTTIDPSQLVRQFASLCKTDKVVGTTPTNEMLCMKNFLVSSGYVNSDVKMITNENIANAASLPIIHRAPTLQDIRQYLSAGYGVKIGVGWYTYDAKAAKWNRTGGHAVSVVGFGYNQAWQDSQMVLRIVNPNLLYAQNRRDITFGDSISMVKTTEKAKVAYPAVSEYMLVGNGFQADNFVENIMVFLPK